MHFRPFIALMAATMFVVPRISFAQTAAEKDAARTQFLQGVEAVKSRQYDAARIHFVQSYSLVKNADTLWNLGRAEMDAGSSLDALRTLRKYRADPQAEPAKKVKADELIATLLTRVGRIRIQVASTVPVTVDKTFVVPQDQRGSAIEVTPGHHVIDAGFPTGSLRQEVDTPPGQVVTVSFDSAPQVAGPAKPGNAAIAPPVGEERSKKYFAWPPPTMSWVLAGAAVVSTGLGVGFALDASSKRDDILATRTPGYCADRGSATCQDDASKTDSQHRSATLSVVFYSAAGAALAGSVLWWALSPREEPTQRTRLAPSVGPNSAGVFYSGSF